MQRGARGGGAPGNAGDVGAWPVRQANRFLRGLPVDGDGHRQVGAWTRGDGTGGHRERTRDAGRSESEGRLKPGGPVSGAQQRGRNGNRTTAIGRPPTAGDWSASVGWAGGCARHRRWHESRRPWGVCVPRRPPRVPAKEDALLRVALETRDLKGGPRSGWRKLPKRLRTGTVGYICH